SETLKSLEGILSQRLRSEQIHLDLCIPDHPIPISADRVLLRQMVLSLINYGLQLCTADRLKIRVEAAPTTAGILIEFETDEQW
ncbi:MAG: hypothetical protein N2646_07635, partial [Bellilinea sp.]|nr:hypothetical protein [Bellilinea sp.]